MGCGKKDAGRGGQSPSSLERSRGRSSDSKTSATSLRTRALPGGDEIGNAGRKGWEEEEEEESRVPIHAYFKLIVCPMYSAFDLLLVCPLAKRTHQLHATRAKRSQEIYRCHRFSSTQGTNAQPPPRLEDGFAIHPRSLPLLARAKCNFYAVRMRVSLGRARTKN